MNTSNRIDISQQTTEQETPSTVQSSTITSEELSSALQRLENYKKGKKNLEEQIVNNERWYRQRHWEVMQDDDTSGVKPASGWLFNSIANKHADAMDNFPSPNILPREENDKEEAKLLTSIVPVILAQDDFEKTYSLIKDDNIQNGTGIYGVFWDKNKHNGLGDITVKHIDILNLFWQPGITDIQMSRELFYVTLQDNDRLVSAYPQLKDKLSSKILNLTEYVHDDDIDTSEQSAVVDWYYKKYQDGKTVLHYCKFVNETVLYATENDIEPMLDELGNVIGEPMSVTGIYKHGKYPFVFDTLYPRKGTPAGFGYIDIGKSAQEYIDRGNKVILQNMLVNARPRYFYRKDSGINPDDFANLDKDLIEVENLSESMVTPVQGKTLSSIYLSALNDKIAELKETTGNRDVSTGGSTSGVTAASAIAAMQEAGSKLSRDNNAGSYRAFKEVILIVIELIRQFYDMPRCFRITGEQGEMDYITYTNEKIKVQTQQMYFDNAIGHRLPLFDVEIGAEKKSPYSRLAQNELALQFYQAGFFNPQLTDQALACLDMMDFDRKEFIEQKIVQNGTMYQQLMMQQQLLLQMAQTIDQLKPGSNMTEQVAYQMQGQGQPIPQGKVEGASEKEALGGDEKESKTTKQARERVANSTSPV